MAWTNVGFDGTITEIQWASLASYLGNSYVAGSDSDCVVTPVGGARSVSVNAGTLYGDGVQSINSAPETVAMTTPTNGQWYVIALRRTWATNTAALVAIAGATTTTAVPSSVPGSFPTLNTNVGVLTDQPIAWAWCNSANTTVVVQDLRKMPMRSIIQNPNRVINGGFDIWQRGTSFTNVTNNSYFADRWRARHDGTGYANTINKIALSPGELEDADVTNCLVYYVSTVGTSTYRNIENVIEDVATYSSRTVTISYWAKALSGTTVVLQPVIRQAFGSGGSSDVLSTSPNVTLGTYWKRYTATILVPSISGKTVGANSFISVVFSFPANVVTHFALAGVQVEEGSIATSFRRNQPNLQAELAACQRYYYRASADSNQTTFGSGQNYNTTISQARIQFPVTMRDVPSTTLETTGTPANYRIYQQNAGIAVTGLTINSGTLSKNGTILDVTVASGLVSGYATNLQANNTTSAYLGFSAEL